MSFFLTETCETQSGLSTTSVLLGQIYREFVYDVPGIATKGTEESPIPIHDDESKFLIRFEELAERLRVEFVVTQVKRGVDGLERLKIYIDLPFLPLRRDDFSTVYDQAIRRNFSVELEALLCGSDCGQDGLTIDSRFDI